MHVLIVLHPDYAFPCALNDFPLSEYFYPWLVGEKKNKITIVANESCRIHFSNPDQLSIIHIPALGKKGFYFLNKLILHG